MVSCVQREAACLSTNTIRTGGYVRSRKHNWFDDYILYTALSNGSGDWGCLIFLLEFAVGSFVLLAAMYGIMSFLNFLFGGA